MPWADALANARLPLDLKHVPREEGNARAAAALARLGFVDRARSLSAEALAEARALRQPFDLAGALHHACFLHLLCRNPDAVAETAAALVALSREQSFPNYLATGTIFHGWATIKAGNTPTGIEQMRRGIEAYRATGAEINRPSWLGLLEIGRAHV